MSTRYDELLYWLCDGEVHDASDGGGILATDVVLCDAIGSYT